MSPKHYTCEEIEGLARAFDTFMSEGKPHFIVIDDSGVNRKMMVRILQDLNYRDINEGKDGIEAIVLLNKAAGKKVIMILDLNMPRMNGLACLKKIKSDADTKDTPVIIVSTETKKEKIIEAMQLGASGYVVKPFTAEQIAGKIKQILS